MDIQIVLVSTQSASPIRSLTAEHIGKLVKLSGIVVSISAVPWHRCWHLLISGGIFHRRIETEIETH